MQPNIVFGSPKVCWAGTFFGFTSVDINLYLHIQTDLCVCLEYDTNFVILPLFTAAMDLKSSNHDVINDVIIG